MAEERKASEEDVIRGRQVSQKNTKKITIERREFSPKARLICLFCGGSGCPKEDFKKNQHENALEGLLSDWITPNIVAMQRPSTRIIREYKVIDQFKKHNIGAIFNLQEPGEHPYCGDGLEPQSGFTYDPYVFMQNGIHFYNHNWVDMTLCDANTMMKIVNQIEFIFRQGQKIAVHCHAGTGRTGLVIVAWLIYGERYTSDQAIKQFQQRRMDGLRKSWQMEYLQEWEKFIVERRRQFFIASPLTLNELVDRQNMINYGEIKVKCKDLPVFFHMTLQTYQEFLQHEKVSALQIVRAFIDPGNRETFKTPWDYFCENEMVRFKREADKANWAYLDSFDVRVGAQCVLDFFQALREPSVRLSAVAKVHDLSVQYAQRVQDLFTRKHFVEALNLREFTLLNRIVKFVLTELVYKQVSEAEIRAFLHCVCVHVLKERQRCAKLFDARKFVFEDRQTPQDLAAAGAEHVHHLAEFLLVWCRAMSGGNTVYNSAVVERVFRRCATALTFETSSSGTLIGGGGDGNDDDSPDEVALKRIRLQQQFSQSLKELPPNEDLQCVIVGDYMQRKLTELKEEHKTLDVGGEESKNQ